MSTRPLGRNPVAGHLNQAGYGDGRINAAQARQPPAPEWPGGRPARVGPQRALQSVELRRHVHAGLNEVEARHALARSVYFNRLCATRDRSCEQQRSRASGLHLVTAAILLWNMVYLERAAHRLRSNGHTVDDGLFQYLAPPGWGHINRSGNDLWRTGARIGAGKFRPLQPLQPLQPA